MNDVCKKWKNSREKKGKMTGKKNIIRRCGECFPPPEWKHFEISPDTMGFLEVLCVFPNQPLGGRGDCSRLPWVHGAGLLRVTAGGWINIPSGLWGLHRLRDLFLSPAMRWEPCAGDSEQVMSLEEIIGSTSPFSFPWPWLGGPARSLGACLLSFCPRFSSFFALGDMFTLAWQPSFSCHSGWRFPCTRRPKVEMQLW